MEHKANQPSFIHPVGYQPFHKEKSINFQLNRWHSLGYWTKEETERAGAGIQELFDWKPVMLAQVEPMMAAGRDLAAAFAYRAAEFFTHPKDPDKIPLYDAFHQRFYAAVQDENVERHDIPYQDGSLPALRITPPDKNGTILCHGGLDSFMEEFYSSMDYFATRGYEVIVLDGPGQGAALRRSGNVFWSSC